MVQSAPAAVNVADDTAGLSATVVRHAVVVAEHDASMHPHFARDYFVPSLDHGGTPVVSQWVDRLFGDYRLLSSRASHSETELFVLFRHVPVLPAVLFAGPGVHPGRP